MIHDRYDPSGQGMFSKSGRQSGDTRTMLERVINSHTTKSRKQGSFLANQMNPYSNIFDEILSVSKDQQSTRPSSANIQNQRSPLYEYSAVVKQKIENANSIQPFQKQITREQYYRPFVSINYQYLIAKYEKTNSELKYLRINVIKRIVQTQKVNVRKNKAAIINETPDPHKKRPKFVWDILKVYKTQQKFRQQTQQNAKEINQQKQQQQQQQLQQPQGQNILQKSMILNNTKEYQNNEQNQLLSKSYYESPSKTTREVSKTPIPQKQRSFAATQQSFNKSNVINKTESQNVSDSQSPQRNIKIDVVPAYPERVKRRISGFTDFNRQLNRSKDSYDKFYKVNEKRFELLKESPVSSNVKHVRDYSFNKQLNREVVSAFKPDEKIPDNGYKPNFEVTKRSLGRVGPCFSKISPHKSLEKKLVGVFQGVHYEYDSWVKNRTRNSIIYKNNKLNLIAFDKQLSREQNPNHALPGYMQTVRSRISLQDLSQKMLEENSFMDQKFLNMNSVFSTKSSISRQSTKSFTQQNFFKSTSVMRSPSQKDRIQTSVSYQKQKRNSLRNNSTAQITNHSFYY